MRLSEILARQTPEEDLMNLYRVHLQAKDGGESAVVIVFDAAGKVSNEWHHFTPESVAKAKAFISNQEIRAEEAHRREFG